MPGLFTPPAPPARGRLKIVAAGMVGAATALLAVAVVKLVQRPASPAPSPTPAPVKLERVYLPVPTAAEPASPSSALAPAASLSPARQPPVLPSTGKPDAQPTARVVEAPAPATPTDEPERIIVPYRGHDGYAQRILVPVTLNGRATVTMAVDTGAPGTIISFGVADRLGILREDDGKLLIQAHGIGGSAPAVLAVLDSLTVGDAAQHFVPVTVTAALSDTFEGLLGMDFVSAFDVKIDAAQRVLILTKPQAGSARPAGHDEQWWRKLFREFTTQRKQWQAFRDGVDQRVSRSEVSESLEMDALKRLRAVADHQLEEAEKLERRLERHASDNSVPREWR